MRNHEYVHGYSEKENNRLYDQANTLTEILHHDTLFPANSLVLEAGCGVGAQTKIIASKNPDSKFISIDISNESICKAKELIRKNRINNVEFLQADIDNLKFDENSFDHVFVCFVLEHLKDPVNALINLKKVLKKGGSITVIEGDHGSTYFHPHSEKAMKTIQCLIDIQAKMGGNSLIGRQLYPLLDKAGFKKINVSPRIVYVDETKPTLVKGFIKETFNAMVEGIKDIAIKQNLINLKEWEEGIADLYKPSLKGGVFCYTFFKAIAIKP
jgi:ubiquinone/menaquinone biosynthesis C-methylase UbiE